LIWLTNKNKKGSAFETPLPLRDTKNNPALSENVLTSKLELNDIDWDGKRVLIRVDYNVPIKDGVVTDSRRITETIDTLKFILNKKGVKGGAKCIVLLAHLGRPGGNFKKSDFTLQPAVPVLKQCLPDNEVIFLPDCVGPEIEKTITACKPGTVFLCENLRFHIEELEGDGGIDEKGNKVIASAENSKKFRDALTRLGDVFVFEAFGAAHRPHASVVGVQLPQRCSGLLMQKEMSYYAKVLFNPARPFLAILGGAKVSDKITVIENLLNLVDEMIIGGGMAYTFKKVHNKTEIGGSLFDKKGADLVERIMKKAKEKNVKIHLPTDHVIADKYAADAKLGITDDEIGIPEKWMALDVGPRTRAVNSEIMGRAKTILWNGPLGVFEFAPFAAGTISAMYDMVKATQRGCITIIGGGDTGAASTQFIVGNKNVASQVSHCSTGGGSSLVLMEGKSLPAVVALSDKPGIKRPSDESKSEENPGKKKDK